ncbi:Na(+)/H(+) antiporter subunit C, partial [Actinotignum timonense]|nr:Na(+)/H(+) antiporter subunit C [Actinotignum timonense]
QQLEESSQRSEVGTDLQETSAEFRDETDTPAPRFGRLGRWNRRHPKRRRHRYVANPNATHGVDGSLGNGVNGANGRNAGRNGHPRGTGTAGRNGNAGGARR